MLLNDITRAHIVWADRYLLLSLEPLADLYVPPLLNTPSLGNSALAQRFGMGRGDLLCHKDAVEGLLSLPVLQHLLKVGDVLREGGVFACVHLVGTVEKG